jgi:hypothetical protein
VSGVIPAEFICVGTHRPKTYQSRNSGCTKKYDVRRGRVSPSQLHFAATLYIMQHVSASTKTHPKNFKKVLICEIYVSIFIYEIYLFYIWNVCKYFYIWNICKNFYMWNIYKYFYIWNICKYFYVWNICILYMKYMYFIYEIYISIFVY